MGYASSKSLYVTFNLDNANFYLPGHRTSIIERCWLQEGHNFYHLNANLSRKNHQNVVE